MNWKKHLRLSWEDGQSWAEQIRDQLRTMIQSGLLDPGQRLPPVRELAQDLGVHFNTVARAYRLLAQEGWIVLHHGRGAYVRNSHPEYWDQEALEDLAQRFVEQAAWFGFDAQTIRQALEAALQKHFPTSAASPSDKEVKR